MFSGDELEGTHHKCLENLQRAAEGGCKICIALILRRDQLGPDPEVEETAMPFLHYRWENRPVRATFKDGSFAWEISFDSEIRWLKRRTMPWNEVHIHAAHISGAVPEWYSDVSKYAASDVDSEPWKVRRELFPLRPIPDSTGHRLVLDIAKIWLEKCETEHNCETSRTQSTLDPEWLPKRLIDITDTAMPQLLETSIVRPCSPCRYATLSHCWGSNPEFTTLTSENFAQFCKGIAINILPKSFCDAIMACNHLKLRYIWIDSLCILQDSHQDWLLHAAEMSFVYQNCYLNLSVDVAENPSQGAFRRRNTDVLQDCFAFSTNPGGAGPSSTDSDSTGSVLDDTSDASQSDEDIDTANPGEAGSLERDSFKATDVLRCLIFAPKLDYLAGTTQDLPLARRGWVVQERLLSPRVLHFLNDRIRWECEEESSLHEGLPYGLPDTGESFDQYATPVFDCFPERFSNQRKWDHFLHWNDIIRMYSQRLLTYPEKDKLVALAAVAQRFAAVFGEEYYAGHFRENMPFDLAWQVLRRHSGQDPSTRRYPTWSWTSVDAEVWASSIFRRLERPLAIVDGVSVVLEDPSHIFGRVNGGQLRLRCLVVRCELRTKEDSLDETYGLYDIRRVHLQEAVGYENCSLHTYLRVKMDGLEKEVLDEIFLIPLVERTVVTRRLPRAFMGILLFKQGDGFYRRLGYWDTDPDNVFNLDHGLLFDFLDRNSQNHHRVVIV